MVGNIIGEFGVILGRYMSKQEVYVVARVTEDNYIQIYGVYSDYNIASDIIRDLGIENPDYEWELLSERLE